MKVKLFILLFLVSPFLKGGHLISQLYSAQGEVSALPQHLTIEKIDSVLGKIKDLLQSNQDPTEEEDAAIIELNIDSMFLEILRDYMKNPTNKKLVADLEQWVLFKPRFHGFLQQAIEKNPENEALQSINLNFPTWWTGYALPRTE